MLKKLCARFGVQKVADDMLVKGYQILKAMSDRGMSLDRIGDESLEAWTNEYQSLMRRRQQAQAERRRQEAENQYRSDLERWEKSPFWQRLVFKRPKPPTT